MDVNSDASELFNVGSNLDDLSGEQVQKLYQELLVKGEEGDAEKPNQLWTSVKPTPGQCIKTKNTKTNEKVFINICTSSTVPVPAKISEEKLLQMLENLDDPDEMVDYRVPMSVGSPHAEVDNKGKGCIAYDVIINPSYLHILINSKIFFGFFMSIVFEALQNKYDVELERNWIMLKTKKFLGKLDQQNVRKQILIQEIPSQNNSLISELPKSKVPKFEILGEPPEKPEYLIAEVKLPGIASAKSIILDVGEDRLVVCTRPAQYKLDIFLPYNLLQEECGSQFDVSSHVLTITMPVQKLH